MKPSEKEFMAEAGELVEEAGRLLLEMQETLEGGVSPDVVNALFRSMHTLKGTSGLFGYQGITDVSHALETLLDEIRLGKVDVSDAVIGFLFKYNDTLKQLVGGLKDKTDVSGYLADIESFRKSIRRKTEHSVIEGVIDESILKVLSEYEEHRLKANIGKGNGIYLIKTFFQLMEFDTALSELTKSVKALGELISTMPVAPGDIPSGSIGFNLLVGSLRPEDEIKRLLKLEVETLIEPRPAKEGTAGGAAGRQRSLAATTVRVDIEKLDRILDTIGELSLAKGAAKRIWAELVEEYGHSPLGVDMYKVSQALQRRVAELQQQVLEIRMIPVGQIFGRLAQVIRRYSREVGRKIDIAVFGEDTEIDKYLAEEIIDPLVHTVRNAIDHGIEPVVERRAKGKTDFGTVRLHAFQRGNNVVIEVSDDGRGMDINKLRRKALDMGIIKPGDVIDDKHLIEVIYTPGFSTSDTVSKVSGRGVGADIVKEKIAALGGFVDVDTKKDEGTTFILTLPITLAIIKALIVRVGSDRFAVPLSSMSETITIEQRLVQTIENRRVYNLRGEVLPIMSLGDVFGIRHGSAERTFAVVLGFGDRRLGLMVDEIMGQQEVIIKSLGEYFCGLRGFAGAAEIGRHELILVLDVEAILGSFTGRGAVHV